MSPSLDIFLPHEPDHPVGWRRYLPGATSADACGTWANMQAASAALTPSPPLIRVFIPGEWVCVRHVDLPKGAVRQADRIVSALLEDDLSDDIDDLHFALLSVEPHQAIVAVIKQTKMQWISACLQAAGLYPRCVLPDWMAFAPDQLIVHDGRCLMRFGQWQGWSSDQTMAPLMLDAGERQPSLSLGVCGRLTPTLAAILDRRYDSLSHADGTMARRDTALAGSLLCGRWKPRTDYGQQWRRWRHVAAAVGLVLLLLPLQHVVTLYQLGAQIAAERQSAERALAALSGEPVVDLHAQFRALQRMRRHLDAGEGLGDLLPQVAHVLASQGPSIQMRGLRFDRPGQTLSLQLQSVDFGELEAIRAAFAVNFAVTLAEVQTEGTQASGVVTLSWGNDERT